MERAGITTDGSAAWRSAFSSHSGTILQFLKRRLPQQEAEDLLQETFLRAMRAGAPERIDNLRSYLLATAKHLTLNVLRRPRLFRPSPGGSPAPLEDVPAPHPGPHENASFHMLSEALSRALSTLPASQRRAFEMAALEGRSYDEVARETGATLAQVKINIYRARRRLTEVLASFR